MLEDPLRNLRYLTSSPGIGGKIKVYPEDFIVKEVIPKSIFRGGRCRIYLLKKKNWETMAAIKEIAKRIGIHYSEIGFAGTKDRHAVTYQYISICREVDLENVAIKDVTLRFVGYGRPLKLGLLLGNFFKIRVRDTTPELLPNILKEAKEKGGFPNYFGIQRFGEKRSVNHIVGKLLLLGKYEEAAEVFLGYPGNGMEGDEARKKFLETKNVDLALEEFPKF